MILVLFMKNKILFFNSFYLIKINYISFSDAPQIKKFSFDENVRQGDVVQITCFAVSPVKPFIFAWKKDGIDLKETAQDVRIENGRDFSILILDNVNTDSSGNYTCIVQNTDGKDRHTAFLSVKGIYTCFS